MPPQSSGIIGHEQPNGRFYSFLQDIRIYMDHLAPVDFRKKETKINPFIAGGTGSDSLNLNMPKTIPAMLNRQVLNIAVAGMEALDETIGRISDFEAKEKELTEYLVKGLEKIENRNYISSIGRFIYRNCQPLTLKATRQRMSGKQY